MMHVIAYILFVVKHTKVRKSMPIYPNQAGIHVIVYRINSRLQIAGDEYPGMPSNILSNIHYMRT